METKTVERRTVLKGGAAAFDPEAMTEAYRRVPAPCLLPLKPMRRSPASQKRLRHP